MMTGTSSVFDLGFRCYLDGQSQHLVSIVVDSKKTKQVKRIMLAAL